MMRLAAAALVGMAMALPACAQHAAAHGGAHGAAPASRGSFASAGAGPSAGRGLAAAPRHYAATRIPPGRFTGPAGMARPMQGSPAYRTRPPRVPSGGAGSGHYRRPYVSPYRARYAYGVVGYGVPAYLGYAGYPDDSEDDQDANTQGPVAPDYGPDDSGEGAYGDLQYGPGAPVSPYLQAPARQSTQLGEAAVTLIFKDGRAPEQIHNYIVTGNTLYVGNRWPSTIPLDQIDLAETVRVNHDAGVDFDLPGTR